MHTRTHQSAGMHATCPMFVNSWRALFHCTRYIATQFRRTARGPSLLESVPRMDETAHLRTRKHPLWLEGGCRRCNDRCSRYAWAHFRRVRVMVGWWEFECSPPLHPNYAAELFAHAHTCEWVFYAVIPIKENPRSHTHALTHAHPETTDAKAENCAGRTTASHISLEYFD